MHWEVSLDRRDGVSLGIESVKYVEKPHNGRVETVEEGPDERVQSAVFHGSPSCCGVGQDRS